jgi:Uma2 family endonuclease
MVAATSVVPHALPEQRFILHGVAWQEYLRLSDLLDGHGVRLTYLEGALEIMSPSEAHEEAKKIVARLLEFYAFFLRIRLNAYGSTTFRKKAKERGAEPDECYVLGRKLSGGFPDIVLEVVQTSPLVDKLDVYDGLGVPEVWVFERGKFAIHTRRARAGYVRAAKSALLPDVDLALIERLAKKDDQLKALEALERALIGTERRSPRARSSRSRGPRGRR